MRHIWRIVVLMLSLLPVLVRPARADDLDKLKQLVRQKFPDVKSISTSELARWLDNTNQPPPRIIDVRSKEEFAVSHLQNALYRHDFAVPNAVPVNAPIVVYCSVGYRAAEFARQLQKQGFTNVRNLEGSIFEWANEGRPLYRGTARVTKVHPYSRKWGRLLNPSLRPSAHS